MVKSSSFFSSDLINPKKTKKALFITQRRKGFLEEKNFYAFQELISLSKILTVSELESTRVLKFGFSLALSGGIQEKFYVETLQEKTLWISHIIEQVERFREARKSLKIMDDSAKPSKSNQISSRFSIGIILFGI